MALVYRIWNKTTDRGYIGQTVRSFDARWRAHQSSVRQGSKFRFHSAIRKYGLNDWNHEILFESDDIDLIRKTEEQLIAEYRYQIKGVGYNAKPGGCGGNIVKPENYERWKQNQQGLSEGEKNGRYSGITNEEMKHLLADLSVQMGFVPGFRRYRRFVVSKGYNNFPKSFSKFRFDGKYSNLVKLVTEETGLKYNQYFRDENQRKVASNNMIALLNKRYNKC
jgi:hypothetical protein